MTRKVFWLDPYLTELDTRVAGVAGDEVTLEATILYALSGGYRRRNDGGIAAAARPRAPNGGAGRSWSHWKGMRTRTGQASTV